MGFGAPDFSSGMFLVRQDVGLWGIRDWQAKELEVKTVRLILTGFASGSYEWDYLYTVPSGKVALICDYTQSSTGKAYVVLQIFTSSGGTKYFLSAAYLYLQSYISKSFSIPYAANADEQIGVYTRNDDSASIDVAHVIGFFEVFGSHPIIPKKLSAYSLWEKGLFTSITVNRKDDVTEVEVTPLWSRTFKFTVKGPLSRHPQVIYDEKVPTLLVDRMIKYFKRKGYELER